MIQIVAARAFPGADKPVFAYPPDVSPPVIAETVLAIYRNHHGILEKIPERDHWNLFFTLAHHSGAGLGDKPARTKATFSYQSHLLFDIDKCDTQRAYEYNAIAAQVLGVPTDASILSNSGNGVHLLYGLKYPIRQSSYFEENREAYKEIIKKINEGIAAAGLPGNADPSVFDAGRVLRMPGTINRKPGQADKHCSVIQFSEALLDFDLQEISGLKKRALEAFSPLELKRQYPRPDFEEIRNECRFVQWAVEKPEEIHEPNFFDLCSTMAACGGETPKKLAQSVLGKATASASLKRQGFEDKWAQAKEYGAPRCTTIHAKWRDPGCEVCPHWGKIPTPLALRGKEFISSESNGYWVYNQKGKPIHPHYQDLSKVFKVQQPYIISEDSRILGFDKTQYRPLPDLRVKAWLEGILYPTEPIRETHRVEFLNKIKAAEAMNAMATEEFFTKSIAGKLNCKNGVLDIIQGTVSPHSPEYGFLYTLPYDIDPEGEGSELFLEWLSTITDDRDELMQSILDIMAYTLWPSYDDHLFVYFIGSGANGKSTLIHVIQAMVGRENYSTASIQQLGGNRFAPALLEGKLVNLSEESSGGADEIGFEAMNVIKALSAGDDLTVEHKGEKGFTLHNKAKLIFSANQAPRFKETGHAIQRRMLVIPFDHKISEPDSRIEAQLIQEVPKIMAMLVKRIQANTAQHGGRFIVSRGGAAAEAARKQVLASHGSTTEWAKECIESGVHLDKDAYITVDAAYAHYRQWCDQNGYSHPATKPSFGRTMCELVITKAQGTGSQSRRVGRGSVRVYNYTRFREGVINGAD